MAILYSAEDGQVNERIGFAAFQPPPYNPESMRYEIRRAQYSDASGIIDAHRRSIREKCHRDYSQAQIDAWAGRDFREERWHQSMDKDWVWVVCDSLNKIYGFGHLQLKSGAPANLAGLYFVPEIMGQGFGRRMLELMRAECHQQKIGEIVLTSTKTAKSFYENQGFVQEGDIAIIQMGNQALECFKMRARI